MTQQTAIKTVETSVEEREQVYLKLLRSLASAGTGAELGVVRRIATWIDSARVIETIAAHESWFNDWGIKEAFVRNEATPEELRSRSAMAVGVLDLLRELDTARLSGEERAEILEHTRHLIRALPTGDREAVKARAYALSSSRRGVEEEAEEEPAVAETVSPHLPSAFMDDEPVSEEELEEIERTEPVRLVGAGAPAEPAAAPEVSALGTGSPELRADLTALPIQEKVARAGSAADVEVLQVLAGESADEVRLALIGNPAASESLLASIARTASPLVAREIYRNRKLFQRPMVRRALLECPNVPSAALVEVVSSMGDLRGLLGLTQSPKVKSLEVKSRARARLTSLFRGLGPAEKISTVRRSGRPLLKALWTDFFRDEELVLRCLQERQLDPGLVLEIARSSVAPRRALQMIGETPSLSASYQVRLALVRNPKTPRPVAHKLAKTLRPADRQALKRNPATAEALREL